MNHHYDTTQDRMDEATAADIRSRLLAPVLTTLKGPKYPDIDVSLVGQDGNAFMIMGLVGNALRAAHVSQDEINDFYDEARRGDYNHLLRTVMEWVSVV